jgi:ornithine cyclodeaminase/alanine dehydrogenase-like protein (mu-crystallin family)
VNVRYLTEADVATLLDVPTAIELLDAACRKQVAGSAQNAPRQRVGSNVLDAAPPVVIRMNLLGAALDGRVGHKAYPVAPPNGATFWFTLYGTSGEILALIEADRLGQIRTGAASGLATRVLAREDARIAAIIGTGWQARTQLGAMCAVRPIERAYAWSRNADNVRAFCAEMSASLGVPVLPADTAEDAVRDADVVAVMTNASEPVLRGAWLRTGTHVNAAGSNRATASEIDAETVRRAALVAVDDLAQAKVEAGDLIAAVQDAHAWEWSRAVRLADIVAGNHPGRANVADITLFESLGIGLWDIAAANHVYDRALERGVGTDIAIPFVRES